MKIKAIATTIVRNAKDLVKRIKVEVVDDHTLKITLTPLPTPKTIHIQLSLFDEEVKKIRE